MASTVHTLGRTIFGLPVWQISWPSRFGDVALGRILAVRFRLVNDCPTFSFLKYMDGEDLPCAGGFHLAHPLLAWDWDSASCCLYRAWVLIEANWETVAFRTIRVGIWRTQRMTERDIFTSLPVFFRLPSSKNIPFQVLQFGSREWNFLISSIRIYWAYTMLQAMWIQIGIAENIKVPASLSLQSGRQ